MEREKEKVAFVFPAFFKERLFYADLLLTVVFNLINKVHSYNSIRLTPPPHSRFHQL
jgi:hypothetical protein